MLFTIAGNDIGNSGPEKVAFSLLNKNHMILQSTDDPDVTYLCHLLVNRTVVPELVTLNLSDEDESKRKIVEIPKMICKLVLTSDIFTAAQTGMAIEYPSQWPNYSCITYQINVGIDHRKLQREKNRKFLIRNHIQ